MSAPSPMVLYDGQTPIGQIKDWSPGKVEAFHIADGQRTPLGFFKDRKSARLAIEAAHAGGPEPPEAA